jgi:hypothetical protein
MYVSLNHLLCKHALQYVIGKAQVKKKWFEMTRRHHPLIYTDEINLLDENMSIKNINTGFL